MPGGGLLRGWWWWDESLYHCEASRIKQHVRAAPQTSLTGEKEDYVLATSDTRMEKKCGLP